MLDSLRQHLREHGHSNNDIEKMLRGERIHATNPAVDRHGVPLIMWMTARYLCEEHRHDCVTYMGPKPYYLNWCGREEGGCPVRQQNKQTLNVNRVREKRAERLRKQGHTCVRLLEPIPSK